MGRNPPPDLVFGKHVKIAWQRAPWGGVKPQDREMAFQDRRSKPVCLPSPRLCGCRPAPEGLEEEAVPLASPQQHPHPEAQTHRAKSPPNLSASPPAARLRSCPSGVRSQSLKQVSLALAPGRAHTPLAAALLP